MSGFAIEFMKEGTAINSIMYLKSNTADSVHILALPHAQRLA